jgi:hypothetical protein
MNSVCPSIRCVHLISELGGNSIITARECVSAADGVHDEPPGRRTPTVFGPSKRSNYPWSDVDCLKPGNDLRE